MAGGAANFKSKGLLEISPRTTGRIGHSWGHRGTGQFFPGGFFSHILAWKLFPQRLKNRYATLQNYFARLTSPNNYLRQVNVVNDGDNVDNYSLNQSSNVT